VLDFDTILDNCVNDSILAYSRNERDENLDSKLGKKVSEI